MSDSILSSNHRERARQIENIKRVARGDKVEKKIYLEKSYNNIEYYRNYYSKLMNLK